MSGELLVIAALVILFAIVLGKTAIVVPQQSAYVVERLC
jgi:regulator of protease activity HflC (stomatin/prohibitin superfamily)